MIDQPGLMGRKGERMPLFAGVGLVLVMVSIVATASLRDPKSLDLLEASAGTTSAPGSPQGAGPSGAASGSPDAPSEPSPLAPTTDLEKASDAPALEKLREQYPRDPKVARKLLVAYSDDARALPQAVAIAKALLELDTEACHDDAVKRTLLRGAGGAPTAAETAFEVMSTSMGSDGPDLLWELATGGAAVSAPTRDRAMKLLADPKVRELASPAVRVAFDLKKGTPCERRALLAAAERDGDKRSLPYLEPLVVTKGCGFLGIGDCYGCFGNRTELVKTISAIKSRP